MHRSHSKGYANILLADRNGRPLCRISRKKRDWYLRKDIAKETPEGIQLTVEVRPHSRLEHSRKFLTAERVSVCVVCGALEDLTIHHVVPRCHFPASHKTHQHGWCVLLCGRHHDEADKLVTALLPSRKAINKVARRLTPAERAQRDLWSIRERNATGNVPPEKLQRLLALSGLASIEEAEKPKPIHSKTAILDDAKSVWGKEFIKTTGGIEATKELFKKAFLSLDPKFLQPGFLEDHL